MSEQNDELNQTRNLKVRVPHPLAIASQVIGDAAAGATKLAQENEALRADIARLTKERDEARADAGVMRELLRRADEACELIPPPASDVYTNSLQADIRLALSRPNPGSALVQERDRYKAALRDFADHGCRHDTVPTIGGRIKSPGDVTGWYEYIRGMDESVRHRASAALSGKGE